MDETSPDGRTLQCIMAKTIHSLLPLPPTQETSLSVFPLFPSRLLTPSPAGFQAVDAHVTLCLCQVFNKSSSSLLHGAYQASQLPPCFPGLPSSSPPQEPPTWPPGLAPLQPSLLTAPWDLSEAQQMMSLPLSTCEG